jgi:hypothetical protein
MTQGFSGQNQRHTGVANHMLVIAVSWRKRYKKAGG